MKRLYLSLDDKKIAGVCGGLAEYLNIDSTVVRVVTVVLAIATAFFPVALAYVLAWVIIPLKPR